MKKLLLSSLILVTLHISAYCQSESEKADIIRVLEKESATWRSGDVQGHADCWYIQPYSRILISTADGAVLDIPPDVMMHPPASAIGRGGTAVNSNYKMSIHGNDAWVSHNEESTSKDGKKTYSYEIRMLEKINGSWKLVGQSIHVYKPK